MTKAKTREKSYPEGTAKEHWDNEQQKWVLDHWTTGEHAIPIITPVPDTSNIDTAAIEIANAVKDRPHRWWEVESVCNQYRKGQKLDNAQYRTLLEKLDGLIVFCKDNYYRMRTLDKDTNTMTTANSLYPDSLGYYNWPPNKTTRVDRGEKFKIGDIVQYQEVNSPSVLHENLTVVYLTQVDGALPTYYRVHAVDKSGWYWCDAHERYFEFQ